MRETIDHTINPVNQADNKLDDIRAFNIFKTPEDNSGLIIVKKYKPLEEILSKLETASGQNNFPHIQSIIEIFNKHRVNKNVANNQTVTDKPHLLIVGGFVRDLLLNKTPKDIDLATDLELTEVKNLLADHFKSELEQNKITLDETGKALGVMRLKFKDSNEEYEIASFRQDSEQSDGRRPDSVKFIKKPGLDAQRRDFTINALIYNPQSNNIIDYVGGLDDIKNEKLRFVGEPEKRLAEDKLRALRYIRFLFKTGFKEDDKAKIAIKNLAPEINQLPSERIIDELNKIVAVTDNNLGRILEYYKDFGLLEKILPEIADLEKCPQGPPYHMEGDVFKHTVMVLNNLPAKPSLELFLAATMHDIAKPDTRQEKSDTKVSFHGHDKLGAEKVKPILKRLKLSSKSQEKIIELIANHIKIFLFLQMKNSKALEMAKSPNFPDQIALLKADNAGTKPLNAETKQNTDKMIEKIIERYDKIIAEQKKFSTEKDIVKKATNGNKIIQLFQTIHGHKPLGKNIGIIESQIKELIDEENIIDPAIAQTKLTDIITNFKE